MIIISSSHLCHGKVNLFEIVRNIVKLLKAGLRHKYDSENNPEYMTQIIAESVVGHLERSSVIAVGLH